MAILLGGDEGITAKEWKKIMAKNARHEYIPTGFPKFDKKARGLPRNSIVMVTSYTGWGKTMLGVNLAYGMKRAGFNVDYLSLEMTAQRIAHRLAACASEKRIDDFVSEKARPPTSLTNGKGSINIIEVRRTKDMKTVLSHCRPESDVCILDNLADVGKSGLVPSWENMLVDLRDSARAYVRGSKGRIFIPLAHLTENGTIRHSQGMRDVVDMLWKMVPRSYKAGDKMEIRPSVSKLDIRVLQEKVRDGEQFNFDLNIDYERAVVKEI